MKVEENANDMSSSDVEVLVDEVQYKTWMPFTAVGVFPTAIIVSISRDNSFHIWERSRCFSLKNCSQYLLLSTVCDKTTFPLMSVLFFIPAGAPA